MPNDRLANVQALSYPVAYRLLPRSIREVRAGQSALATRAGCGYYVRMPCTCHAMPRAASNLAGHTTIDLSTGLQ